MKPGESFAVFVYGTLKRAHGNHRFLDGSEFLGPAVTVDKYALHVDGLPMVDRRNPVSTIHGELYQVSRETLAALDHLEGHPDLYQRRHVKVRMQRCGVHRAWMYFHDDPSGPIIDSGRYEEK